ncbi:MAG: lipid A-modifier LpxR family protein [Flavobacteriaceae bacterium]
MQRTHFITFLLGCFSVVLLGQSHLTLTVDNDLYFRSDFYYSSGLFLEHGKERTQDTTLAERQFRHWKLGQLIYTPRKRYATQRDQLDYPFSGYLFLRYSQEKIRPGRSGYTYGAEIGVSGDASLAKPVQNLYHELVLQLPPLSWTAQMPQQLHAGIRATYFRTYALTDGIAWVPDVSAVASTHQTLLSARMGLVLGSTQKIPWDVNPLLNTVKGWGVYAGWQQQYLFYDFPLEGSLFNDLAAFTLPPNRLRNRFEIGLTLHNEQWKILGTMVSSSRDTATQRDPRHEFLTLCISRFF